MFVAIFCIESTISVELDNNLTVINREKIQKIDPEFYVGQYFQKHFD